MDQRQPYQHGRDTSLPEEQVKGRRRNPEYTRSFLGLPSILEREDTDHQTSCLKAQLQQLLTASVSNNTGTTTANELDLDEKRDISSPFDVRVNTVMIPIDGTPRRQDTQYATSTTESQTIPTHPLNGISQVQMANAAPHLSPDSQPEAGSPKENCVRRPTSQDLTTVVPPTQQPDGAHSVDQEEKPRLSHAHREEVEHGVSPSQDHGRLHSILSSPLTHPNGVSMFPHLSTPEQELLSQEALTQAEESIIAENLTGSDVADGESDGGYDSEGFSSGSTSAESSVRDYMFENGRRYHRFREGTYNFPNDDVEQEREDMKHAMVKLLCSQKLHFAPIGNNPQEVLDLGTGTGIWAIEMGDQFPSAHILGIDLSPIQPDWLPPNVRFMVDDMESPWLHPRNHFDYIHSRHTVMAIKQWDRLYRRAFEHVKPGGWMEMQEIHHRPRSAGPDGTVPADHPVARFWTLVTEGLAALGVNLDISSGGVLAGKMQEAGFTNVTERVFHVPIGTWPKNKVLKTVGLYWRTILLDGLQAIALGPLTRGLHWTRDEVELFLMDVRRAYHDNSALMYMPLHIIYAQKPMTAY
ncbi:Methyltransferase type 11 [Metarhizium album ARSEF 1941]|uniref:Methyltransferase type 11 n=1 Tax=Metarhizium album (strain ARSEF 1941) TaxID=1081103 RepID=A0A0B2WK33_METAS|nr:Methyltransferase type 11 [Metarhizium album ARSEF 1941]KHN94258.1 Methyltransferase type 11 [Metarhizium album ARSEF 1941]